MKRDKINHVLNQDLRDDFLNALIEDENKDVRSGKISKFLVSMRQLCYQDFNKALALIINNYRMSYKYSEKAKFFMDYDDPKLTKDCASSIDLLLENSNRLLNNTYQAYTPFIEYAKQIDSNYSRYLIRHVKNSLDYIKDIVEEIKNYQRTTHNYVDSMTHKNQQNQNNQDSEELSA